MSSSNKLYYLQRKDIDEKRWNDCIDNASNGLIYSYTFYLDAMCTNWDAIVLNDYEAVMPLPWRKKLAIHYLYQPFFTAVLGVFGQHLSSEKIGQFLTAIPKKFKYWDLHLNEDNLLDINMVRDRQHYHISERKNFFLNLSLPYPTIKNKYKHRAKRTLKSLEQEVLTIQRDDSPSFIIEQYAKHYSANHRAVTESDYQRLKQLCQEVKHCCLTYTVYDMKQANTSFCLLLQDQRNLYPILGGSTPAGKAYRSFTFLIDAIIKDYAEKKKTFRFEGSDMPGIAFFNEQFSPNPVSYSYITRNNLPGPLHYFKK